MAATHMVRKREVTTVFDCGLTGFRTADAINSNHERGISGATNMNVKNAYK
jgi:hypothetical protein